MPDCRLVAVTLPQGGINDGKKIMAKNVRMPFN